MAALSVDRDFLLYIDITRPTKLQSLNQITNFTIHSSILIRNNFASHSGVMYELPYVCVLALIAYCDTIYVVNIAEPNVITSVHIEKLNQIEILSVDIFI